MAKKKRNNRSRTSSGKIPQGRTLTTQDKYLDKKARQPNKQRPLVVIETNDENDLAVVQLSSRKGKNRTRLQSISKGSRILSILSRLKMTKANRFV